MARYPELNCVVEQCERDVFSKGRSMCAMHYYRERRNGYFHTTAKRMQAEDWESRFWDKVDFLSDSGCYGWTGTIDRDGYGVFRVQVPRQMNVKAHRTAWKLTHGSIDNDLTIDHICNNARCVNPLHMELVTASENSIRAAKRRAGTWPDA